MENSSHVSAELLPRTSQVGSARDRCMLAMNSTLNPRRVVSVLEHPMDEAGISREEAIFRARHDDLDELLRIASDLRSQFKGHVVSYSKKIFIPLTHLCRDYCGYCTFRSDPIEGIEPYMTPEEVLSMAETGRRAGCKEVLFSLGDQPEAIFPEAKEFLRRRGFTRTLDYLAAMTDLVLDETGLLPHSNPGVMGRDDLQRLRESNVSLGLMLESTSTRLRRPAGPHWKAPDKVAPLRLKTIEEAGRLRIAFTTGILIGIGESFEERIDSLFVLRELHEKYGHIQEVILQPFRAKAGTRMALASEPSAEDLLRTVAIARLIFGGSMNIQSPPNLMSDRYPLLVRAGINDWGGISPVTRDFINPESEWPQISVLAERMTAEEMSLRERLAIYPEYSGRPEFVSPRVRPHLEKLRAEDGYARLKATKC